jgi:hypothetical protein
VKRFALLQEGKPHEEAIPIPKGGLRIGRHASNEITLPDPKVSRHHASVWTKGDSCYVRDEGSTNGTFVNDERIAGTSELRPGDTLRVGSASFTVVELPVVDRPREEGVPTLLMVAGAALGAVLLILVVCLLQANRGPSAAVQASPSAHLPGGTVTPTGTYTPTLALPLPTETLQTPPTSPAAAPPLAQTTPTSAQGAGTATQMPSSPTAPAPTHIPPSPTAIDWSTADWTVIARTLLESAQKYRPQMLEIYQSLNQDQVDCPRLAELLDSLAEAPHHDGMNDTLAERRGYPGVEGELWKLQDSYADAVNQFRLATFRSIRNACASGIEPNSDQRQRAIDWMDLTSPAGKLEYIVAHLEPVVGG